MFSSCRGGVPKGGMEVNHGQEPLERDALKAKFTRWLETVIKRARIDYLRKYEDHPEIISYEDIPEAERIAPSLED